MAILHGVQIDMLTAFCPIDCLKQFYFKNQMRLKVKSIDMRGY